jgi:hypothetical protein
MLIKRFWYEEYPGFDELIERVKVRQISAEETALINTRMYDLLAAWGLRLVQPPEVHKGFVFKDESAYVQFLLTWS